MLIDPKQNEHHSKKIFIKVKSKKQNMRMSEKQHREQQHNQKGVFEGRVIGGGIGRETIRQAQSHSSLQNTKRC